MPPSRPPSLTPAAQSNAQAQGPLGQVGPLGPVGPVGTGSAGQAGQPGSALGSALRGNARGLSFDAGQAMMTPSGSGAPAAAASPEADLGLTRGTEVNEGLRARVTGDFLRGRDLIAAGQFHGAIAVNSALYALPNLTNTVRFKICYHLAVAHSSLGNHESALSFLREAQGLPAVAGALRAMATSTMGQVHRDRVTAGGGQVDAAPTGSVRAALDALFNGGIAAYRADQFQAAHDQFMRMYTDSRAIGHQPDARAGGIINAGLCKVRMGQALEGARLAQDGLAVAGIEASTRAGAFGILRSAQLAMSGRQAGQGSARTRGDSERQFDIASAALRGGDWAGGIEALMQVYTGPAWARIGGDDRGAFVYDIGVCHQHLGHRDEALVWYQNALDRHSFRGRDTVIDAMRNLRLADARGARPPAPAPLRAPVGADSAVARFGGETDPDHPSLALVAPTFAPEGTNAAPSTGQPAARLDVVPEDFEVRTA